MIFRDSGNLRAFWSHRKDGEKAGGEEK